MKQQAKTISILTAFGLFAVLSGVAMAQQNTQQAGKTMLSAQDLKFVHKAAMGGMAEVELGQLAVQKAANNDVKQFGQRMVDDHSKANDQLKQIASNKGLTLRTRLDKKSMALKDRLSKLSGAAFDSSYMKAMVEDHKEDVAEFRKASKQCQDPDLKAFATSTLPTLEQHLSMATDIHHAQSPAYRKQKHNAP